MIKLILDNFSWKGLVITIVSLLPTIFMALLPPQKSPTEIKDNIALMIMENIGRTALIIILLFSKKVSIEK